MLGFEGEIAQQNWFHVVNHEYEPGKILGEPKLLFRKIEDEEIQKEIETLKNIGKI